LRHEILMSRYACSARRSYKCLSFRAIDYEAPREWLLLGRVLPIVDSLRSPLDSRRLLEEHFFLHPPLRKVATPTPLPRREDPPF